MTRANVSPDSNVRLARRQSALLLWSFYPHLGILRGVLTDSSVLDPAKKTSDASRP
jgi:hypothetical protein